MPYASIHLEKLTPHVGGIVSGIDLSKPLDESTCKQVHDALIDNSVIFFRDQHLTPEQQKAFGRLFGELHLHPAAPRELPEHPEILVIHADETSKHVAGENWHSDVSCDVEPPMGSILYMHELPPVGGDTLFASMYAAYEALSEPMKRFLEPLTARHEGEHVYRGRYGLDDTGKTFPRAEHPVIRTHPVSGRKALFVNGGFTTRIVQLSRAESDAALDELFAISEDPSIIYEHQWRLGDLVIWDNWCSIHARKDFPREEPRLMRRLTIEGQAMRF